jgi:hypothetical protein
MSEELRPCPFCGAMPMGQDDRYMCSTLGCVMQEDTISAENWNTRPIEDALNKRIAELEAENDMLKQLSQPIEVWSDEKKQIYKINERRSVKSGSEECGDGT